MLVLPVVIPLLVVPLLPHWTQCRLVVAVGALYGLDEYSLVRFDRRLQTTVEQYGLEKLALITD